MTKSECLERAAKARHAAKVAAARHALYASTFGGNSQIAQDALLSVDVANEAADKWENIATWNSAIRNAAIRKQTLPPFLFGYQ